MYFFDKKQEMVINIYINILSQNKLDVRYPRALKTLIEIIKMLKGQEYILPQKEEVKILLDVIKDIRQNNTEIEEEKHCIENWLEYLKNIIDNLPV